MTCAGDRHDWRLHGKGQCPECGMTLILVRCKVCGLILCKPCSWKRVPVEMQNWG